ncbi:MAG: 1,4-alpha-glucan branching protein GlgB [Azospirillum sp.]|nr:1,4-alpha-glucan branching protein GlgB [Azospirillum sp.]
MSEQLRTGPQAANRPEILAVVNAEDGNPFGLLGMHIGADGMLMVRSFQPGASAVSVHDRNTGASLAALERVHPDGFFEGVIAGRKARFAYRLHLTAADGTVTEIEDPYRFSSFLGELDLHLLGEGQHLERYQRLGAHLRELDGVTGAAFAVWAPSARRVAVVGDFNDWDGRRHGMRYHPGSGVWEIFLPGVGAGARYKYEIKGPNGELLPLKADPHGFAAEPPPQTASVVHDLPRGMAPDDAWLARRRAAQDRSAPIAIYEVHLGSWRRHGEGNRYLSYRELADQLVPYVADLGFTHIELLPISEHPFDGSWGYQPVGLFAPTSRFGSPEDFQALIDRCHQAGLGVLLDWVPGHFPTDPHGLGDFDGTHLYEHADPRQGHHLDWNTLIYNYGRLEVYNFLLSNALFWLDRYGIDGLRVDAVASMLYLDYSRKAGEWIPNREGGRENLEAVEFLRRMNQLVYDRVPGAITVAEESTSWPAVSRPTDAGGLGFGYKWNMGWMHDTLAYFREDPIARRWHHDKLTFGMLYAYSENFVLPLSHDEVVHGKGSLLGKMPGDNWQKFANLRAYFAFMWSYPGKKLLFMGGEFAQWREWNHDTGLDWNLLDFPAHRGIQSLIRDLNRLYCNLPALHRRDCDPGGFEWIDCDDRDNSVISYLRKGDGDQPPVLVVCNFTPVPHSGYRLGVPAAGTWRELLNTDAEIYGGSDLGNSGGVAAQEVPCHGRPVSLVLTLPPLATVVLTPAPEASR